MERSTALNKNLKPSSCKPLREGIPEDVALKLFFPIFFLALIAGCETIQISMIPREADRPAGKEDGRSRSMFDAQGIAWGSERVERFIYFPTGIPSIGSMRQRGHHAITLSEQTYFDEPGLFKYYFEFK
ncbi:MAG TPA: hypothetical protein VFG28_09650 [Syntrophales bacterium]|nr:hypothetical protein [Syntrophales bacterium]